MPEQTASQPVESTSKLLPLLDTEANACGKTCVAGICGVDPDPENPC